MIKSPQQALFDAIYVECRALHQDTFEYLPSFDQKYPFIHIGQNINTEISNNDLIGSISQTINIWGTKKQVAKIDELVIKVRDNLTRIKDVFGYSMYLSNINIQKINDNTTTELLIHIVMECDFNYIKKG